MTTDLALLQTIIMSPDEDVPRLIFADWLEENGEAARAAFVRVQVELARGCDRCGGDGLAHGADRPFEWNDRADYGKCVVCWDSRRRERKLFAACSLGEWFPVPTDRMGATLHRSKSEIAFRQFESAKLIGSNRTAPATEQTYYVARGFIDSIQCSWQDFLRHHRVLIWSPAATDECPNTHAITRAHPGNVWKCPSCKGKGRIQRSMPATAQPVRTVKLTTAPTNIRNTDEQWIAEYRFDRVKCSTCCTGSLPLNSWTCPEWPGIVFEMPTAGIFASAIRDIARGMAAPMQAFGDAVRGMAPAFTAAGQAMLDAWPRDADGNLIQFVDDDEDDEAHGVT